MFSAFLIKIHCLLIHHHSLLLFQLLNFICRPCVKLQRCFKNHAKSCQNLKNTTNPPSCNSSQIHAIANACKPNESVQIIANPCKYLQIIKNSYKSL